MKKVVKTIFSFTLLGLFMFSCSSELVVGNADETSVDATPSPSSFLSVSIVASNATDTRESDSDGTYRDGSEKENAVSSVLFLFYDKKGNPTVATKNEGVYYTYCYWNDKDVDNGSITGDSLPDDMRGNHIEKALSERLINITIPSGKEKPAQLIVVLNPTDNWKDWTIKTLDELEDVIQDFETNLTEEGGKFVMTNSVYVDEPTRTLFNAKILEDSHYKTTEQDALENPVVVFVERVVARIDLTIDIKGTDDNNEENPIKLEDGSYIYYTGVSIPSELKEDGNDEDIYVKFLGWNVFSTPNQSRLIKKVNKDWSSQGLFGSTGDWVIPWTSTTFRRSFWAINPPLTTNGFKYNFGSFTNGEAADEKDFNDNGAWTADHYPIADPEKYTTAYFQENAAPAEETPASDDIDEVYGSNYVSGAPVKPSKVIIAAQLVNKDGTPRSLAKWAGKTYTENGLISSFASKLNMWKIKKEVTGDKGDTTTYTHIAPEDLVFTPSQDEGQKYKVNLELAENGETVQWYTKGEDEDVFTPMTENEIKAAIEDVTGTNAVMVWNNGYTYFYFDIRHFGLEKTPGYYGVVRNHIYDARVRSVSGLGTPVFDEFEDIDVVTQPTEDNWVIAAEVRILSWRVVKQDYDLKW